MSHFSPNPDNTNGHKPNECFSFAEFYLILSCFPPSLLGPFHLSHRTVVRLCIKTTLMLISTCDIHKARLKPKPNHKLEGVSQKETLCFMFKFTLTITNLIKKESCVLDNRCDG